VNNRYAHARYVLACRCGKALSPEDMCRLPVSKGDARFVRPIVCPKCAMRAWNRTGGRRAA
jgi:hypothetical protein